MLYLFLMSIPMSLIAICIGYADHILYPAYASAPRIWEITPMQDQLLGALIMWVPGGLFFFAIISVVFFRWQARGAEDGAAGAQGGLVSRGVPQEGWAAEFRTQHGRTQPQKHVRLA